MATGHHYGPGPWVDDLAARRLEPGLLPSRRRGRHRLRPHRRPAATPSRSTRPRSRARSATRDACPRSYLLWFHHVPWDYRDASGPHAVGRAGRALRRAASTRCARCARTWDALGAARRCRAPRRGRRLPRASRRTRRSGGATPRIAYFQSRARAVRCRRATRRRRTTSTIIARSGRRMRRGIWSDGHRMTLAPERGGEEGKGRRVPTCHCARAGAKKVMKVTVAIGHYFRPKSTKATVTFQPSPQAFGPPPPCCAWSPSPFRGGMVKVANETVAIAPVALPVASHCFSFRRSRMSSRDRPSSS